MEKGSWDLGLRNAKDIKDAPFTCEDKLVTTEIAEENGERRA